MDHSMHHGREAMMDMMDMDMPGHGGHDGHDMPAMPHKCSMNMYPSLILQLVARKLIS
jgi:hypothetical protein